MVKLEEVQVGDVVRVDDDPQPWRVEAKDQKSGMLTLESLHAYPRVAWDGVHEFRVQRSGAFS